MQPLRCDGECGQQAQIMITVIETGEVLALCMSCTADWGKAISDKRDQAVAAEQASLVDQASPVDQEKANVGTPRPTPRQATRRRTTRRATPFPSIVSGASTTPDVSGHDDSMEHGPTPGPDIAGHHADDIATVE